MELNDWLSRLDWRQPAWLWLAVQPFVVLALRRIALRHVARNFAEPTLLPWVRLENQKHRLPWRSGIHILAWTLAAAAAAGPRLALLEPGQSLRAGVDWMLVVDLSESMQANDIAPTRLKRARIEALQLLSRLGGDRVGLIAYAGEAHVIAPPSYDFGALQRYLDILQPELMPTRGSRPDGALDLARAVLADDAAHPRAVLLMTDQAHGEEAIAAARALRAAGISLFVMGMGSAGGTVTVDQHGSATAVPVPLEQRQLMQLAQAGGGKYATVADDDSDLLTLYDDGIAELARVRTRVTEDDRIQWQELYVWCLLPSLLLFALSLWPGRIRSTPGAAVTAAGMLALLYAPFGHSAPTLSEQAYRAYTEQRFQTARDLYGRMVGYEARMGEGASAYRMRDFERAAREFTDALLVAGDEAQRADALLNLGNSYFQRGDFRSAAVAFEDALRYRPDFDAAQRNLHLAQLVADEVERRLPGNRPGPGQRSREARSDDRPGPRTLSESDATSERSVSTPVDADTAPTLAQLVARGIEFAQVAAKGQAEHSTDPVPASASAAAAAHMAQLQQQPVLVWRRIFEREEGFLAPLAEPRRLPELAPW